MDLDSFIGKYGPEWRRLDQACGRGRRGLARLSGPDIQEILRLYQRATAHLAEVQTRYRDPGLQAYLNSLVSRAHAAVYGVRPRTLRGFVALFGARYREAIRRTAPYILVMAGLLVAVALATEVWVVHSREAQAGLLSPLAREAVRRAGGHRVERGVAPAGISTFILVNNVQVAFLAFALGISAGIGTAYVVVQNAVLIGALAGAFQVGGKPGIFWSLVLPHGLLELTAICIAAGAGFRMGWSLVDPGDRPRSRALAEEAGDAVLVVVGVIPAFVVAAIIEGFLTGSSVPAPVELAVGTAVAAGYLVLLFGLRPSGPLRKRRARSPSGAASVADATAVRTP